MKLELTPRQYGTVAAVATALAAGVILSVALGVFLLLARFVAIFSSVFLPLPDGLHGIARNGARDSSYGLSRSILAVSES